MSNAGNDPQFLSHTCDTCNHWKHDDPVLNKDGSVFGYNNHCCTVTLPYWSERSASTWRTEKIHWKNCDLWKKKKKEAER